ncbi:2,3-dihydro-2,3-dihydroxybenzoate dehydrogenase [Nocardiopsis kunsanensis]|uniref:2,3-dihydro-2,3-dihydroxybenzoate dehydrogenase n=1 Tax=Nocardiopsis kunsanensis TaxID=141693 RepID=A0A919CFJ1_9ACTN|nr:2,3-dihydro-2,3-dihydroxybenzoate dehydrogenase [Nocardiopsis kunsanensis]GHD17668.1 2,3-dihydro-2,3-dihydroxybenzoate dehydrogenase [Nocardiopsis kunsanensis]
MSGRKVALVTGAAGGIGLAVVRGLGQQGTAVAAVDNDATALEESTQKLIAEGLEVVPVLTDVRSPDEAEAAFDTVQARLGPVDQLVNAAGIMRPGKAWELDEHAWEESLAVNATGVFTMSRAAARHMVPRSSGAIVTVASNAAGTARTRFAAYCASKAAAAMYTKCLGLELAEHGIRCNVVAPGSTDTPMLHSLWSDGSGPRATLDGDPEAFRVGIPLRRIASPDDVADSVVFLLSDRAAHITMHTLTVDGGATLGT